MVWDNGTVKGANLEDGSVTNAKVASDAAIARTKLAPAGGAAPWVAAAFDTDRTPDADQDTLVVAIAVMSAARADTADGDPAQFDIRVGDGAVPTTVVDNARVAFADLDTVNAVEVRVVMSVRAIVPAGHTYRLESTTGTNSTVSSLQVFEQAI